MKRYNIVKVDDSSCYVQHRSKGQWLFFMGSDHIRFDNERNAFTWLVQKKFGGDYDKAEQAISYSNYKPTSPITD